MSRDVSRRDFVKRAGVVGLTVPTLAGLLAACGSGDDDAATTSAAGGAGGKIGGEVSMLSTNVADPSLPQAKADIASKTAWEKLNPGATLKLEPAPFDSFVTVATTRFRARRLSDTLELQPGTAQAAAFPVLEPLRKGDIPSLDALSMWYATTMSPETPDVYAGVPIGITGTVLYANKALFGKAGLDPDEAPATWDDLGRVATKLKGAGITPIAFSGDAAAFIPWLPLLAQVFSADDLESFRRGEIPVTDERFKTTLGALSQAARDGWFDPTFVDRQYGQAASDFGQGRAAMIVGWIAGGLNWVDWDKQLGKDGYSVFPMPTLPGVSKAVQFTMPNLMVGINKQAANPDGARSWVEYLGSKDGLSLQLELGGAMPNRDGIDVKAVTGSPGAVAIADLLDSTPAADAPINFRDVDDFLSSLEEQNKQ